MSHNIYKIKYNKVKKINYTWQTKSKQIKEKKISKLAQIFSVLHSEKYSIFIKGEK